MKRKMVTSVCMLACIGMLAGCGGEEPDTAAMAVMDDVGDIDSPHMAEREPADDMTEPADIAGKETSAEILLESKGFSGVEVTITDTGADVVVEASELTEAQKAQIEDIIVRKTGVASETIIISTTTEDLGTVEDVGLKQQREEQRQQIIGELTEIINDTESDEGQRQRALDEMDAINDIAEKETAAEILLESKRFPEVMVSITDTGADVMVRVEELSEAQRAQIEDIVAKETGVAPETIIISTTAADLGITEVLGE